MARYFLVTHSAFFDTRLKREVPANQLGMHSELRALGLVARLTASGATDAKAIPLTAAEHRQIVLARFPSLRDGRADKPFTTNQMVAMFAQVLA